MTSGLGAPPPTDELRHFPEFRLDTDVQIFRIHRRDRAPWWFAIAGEGRFDLLEPRGTCYVAETPAGAFIEVFGDVNPVPAALVGEKYLTGLRVPRTLRLADATASVALGYGVTLELSAGVRAGAPYAHTQPWAEAFADAGFDGTRYRCRHDAQGREIAYALFAAYGEAEWPVSEPGPQPIRQELCDHVRERFGLIVLPEP